MKLTSKITQYNEKWPEQFESEAKRIANVFSKDILDIHHVGSTAVEGLAAKPEIDILIVVSNTDKLNQWTRELKQLDYKRGKDLSPEHHFFKRDHNGVRTHKLHICKAGQPDIVRILNIRDHLRYNSDDKNSYEKLKLALEQENKTGIEEYLKGKKPFLDNLEKKISKR